MHLITLSKEEAARAVDRYNECFGTMERVLGCLSLHSRMALNERRHEVCIENLVWTLKSWWGVQGVRTETRDAMSNALVDLVWPEGVFVRFKVIPEGAESFATSQVRSLVELTRTYGATRNEVSLASKVLHWILPWHVPVFDSYVCKQLGISTSSDLLESYSKLAQAKIAASRQLEGWGDDWFGNIGPHSLLRAIDKCLWWEGGGDNGKAVIVKRPWTVVDRLKLDHLTY